MKQSEHTTVLFCNLLDIEQSRGHISFFNSFLLFFSSLDSYDMTAALTNGNVPHSPAATTASKKAEMASFLPSTNPGSKPTDFPLPLLPKKEPEVLDDDFDDEKKERGDAKTTNFIEENENKKENVSSAESSDVVANGNDENGEIKAKTQQKRPPKLRSLRGQAGFSKTIATVDDSSFVSAAAASTVIAASGVASGIRPKVKRQMSHQDRMPLMNTPKRKCSFSSFSECRYVVDGGQTTTFLFSIETPSSPPPLHDPDVSRVSLKHSSP